MSFGTKPNSSASKISFNLGSSTGMAQNKLDKGKVSNQVLPIKMSLGSVQKAKETPPSVVQKSALAAKVFDESSDSEEEEMPPEAKMRMKNVGRDTITASGPNSFGKGKHGFIDRQKIIEKELQEEMDRISGDKKPPK